MGVLIGEFAVEAEPGKKRRIREKKKAYNGTELKRKAPRTNGRKRSPKEEGATPPEG